MKKILLSILMFALLISLMSCSSDVLPLENPQPDLFSLLYTGDNYEVYKRTNIDEEKIHVMIGFPLISDKGTSCIIGMYHLENYIVLYKEAYYDLQAATRLNLFHGNDLTQMGVDVNCENDA